MGESGFHGARIQGARKYQQDAFRDDAADAGDGPSIVVIADGMGGHAGGDVASRIAVDVFLESFRLSRSVTSVPERLRRAAASANAAILDEAAARPELEGMGATLVAVAQADDGLYHISIGDSPLWRFGADGLVRLNADHSMADVFRRMAEKGEMTPEQAARHPQRNQLRSVLGEEELELIDCPTRPMTFEPGDLLLAASDGLQTLTDGEIAAILRTKGRDPKQAVTALLASVEAKGAPKQDNATAYVWRPDIGGAATAAIKAPPPVRARGSVTVLTVGIGLGLLMGVVLTLALAPLFLGHRNSSASNSNSQTSTHVVTKAKPAPAPKRTVSWDATEQ